MGNVPSKSSSTGPSFSASTPSSLSPNSVAASALLTTPARASFSVESSSSSSSSKEQRHLQHRRSYSYSARPFATRSQHSDSGNSTGKSQHEVALVSNSNIRTDSTASPSTESTSNTKSESESESVADLKTARAEKTDSMTFSTATTALLADKPLPASPSCLPPNVPEKDTPSPFKVILSVDRSMDSLSPKTALASATATTLSPTENSRQKDTIAEKIARASSFSRQSIHSQSSLSDKSIVSNSSTSSGSSGSGHGSRSRSGNSSTSTHTATTPSTSVTSGTTESLGQLSLQRFPTGESEYKIRPLQKSRTGGVDHAPCRQSHDAQSKTSRTTSTVSSSSARSSSGSSGFRFTKPNLSFKPLLYSHGNDSRNQQHMYQHHNNSSSSASPNGHPQQHQSHHHHQAPDPFANSPFPSVLMSIKLPQSLLDKYVIDQESFRHGKGIWGIGKYSWTITVLSRSNGKKYVIKRVSKSLLPPSAYYHYPTTAHRLCTCPACKSSRDQLLLTGQLDPNELENIQEVLVIQKKGKKELPQLPPPSSPKQASSRPLSASSISSSAVKETAKDKESKDKRRSFNIYSCHNSSVPSHQGKPLTLSPNSSPQSTPANSRPSTPSPSPLRLFSGPGGSTTPMKGGSGKAHNRSQSHSNALSSSANALSPLLPSATPLSWPHRDNDPKVAQTKPDSVVPASEQLNSEAQTSIRQATRPSVRSTPKSLGMSFSSKKRPALQRHASVPNLSQAITGLDVLEDDPSRLDQLKQLSRLNKNDWHPQNGKTHRHQTDGRPFISGSDRRLVDSPLSMTPTMPSLQTVMTSNGEHHKGSDSEEDRRLGPRPKSSMDTERRVSPFDTNEGEFKHMDPESPSFNKASPAAPQGFVPPQHALPMELVLLQTYNDSDHLPEHHEWTQDQEYWYYVTKAHGVKRRKLKKVSTWWLDMGSLGSALLSASSSSSEPIATGPIYNMGRGGAGNTTPLPSSPLSSEVALSNAGQGQANGGWHTPKESIAPMASHESSHTSLASHTPSNNTIKRQSSPRNSYMGKYYHVDWDEYVSL